MKTMKKNDVVEVDIEDMTADGAGLGKIEGYPLFVKDAVIGDRVRVKAIKTRKNYGYARLMEVLEPSPHRVEAVCPLARQCGGCQLQMMSYDQQLKYKHSKVANNLRRIGHIEDVEVLPVLGMEEPYHYRNKAQFPVGSDREGKIITGFYAGRTHSIIPVTSCCIGVPVNEEVLEIIRTYMEEYQVMPYDEENGTGLVRHILIRYGFTTKEVMVCVIINGDNLPHSGALVDKLREIAGLTSISININKERTNVILGKQVKTIWGQDYITDYIGDIKYQISPLSFYQVNPAQTKVLYEKALEYAGLTGEETVWDLYCGIGTISLFLARQAKQVYGVEIIPEAIADARRNAEINGITNVEFFTGKAEEVLPHKYEEDQVYAEVIVVDPPRKGCDEQLLDTIVKMQPERVVYVSCDSATLARDLRYLSDRGYVVRRVQPVDMFGHTVHVETVVLMSRVDG